MLGASEEGSAVVAPGGRSKRPKDGAASDEEDEDGEAAYERKRLQDLAERDAFAQRLKDKDKEKTKTLGG
jgi:pre-mRNA-splicing factor ATP-dependent RNA helicase DHX16